MCALDLCTALHKVDSGRFSAIIHVLKINDECAECDFFNLAIKDKRKQFRCRCWPSCISATLNDDLISYLNWKLGWITKKEHFDNIGINIT